MLSGSWYPVCCTCISVPASCAMSELDMSVDEVADDVLLVVWLLLLEDACGAFGRSLRGVSGRGVLCGGVNTCCELVVD